jgi:sulfate/thiosulfate transport system substrate-binding protein
MMSLWQRLTQHLRSPQQQPAKKSQLLNSLKSFVSLFLLGITLSVAVASCAPSSNNPASDTAKKRNIELTLVSFAVTKAAHAAIIPKFVEQWQKEHGQTVTFSESYGGSGSQTRAVIDGLEADIVHLALALDTQKIEKAGLIDTGWEKEFPNGGIVSKSVAAIVTREGNPKGIKTWTDLVKDGVKVITADPKTSGVARWNFLALWGSVLKTGGDEAKALDFTSKVYKNVPILTRDAREASDVFFKQGQGDALINYENEVILAADKGEKLPYTIPEVNVSIDNPIAIIDKNVTKHGTKEVAEAFVKFLYTPEAQREFAKAGFRSVDATVAAEPEFVKKYPPVKTLFTAQDLGGWGEIQQKFFDDGGVFDKIQGSIKR